MLSVIICSVNPDLLSGLRKNIDETIGIPYEIVAVDNSVTGHGICKVYNEGAARANYDLLCFVHEDVLFETKNWGRIVADHLADPQTGLIGIAGGDTKSRVPSSWSVSVVSNHINVVQHYKYKRGEVKRVVETDAKQAGNKKRVVALDGAWLCSRKDIFDEFRFDEAGFPGFHGYDIDYSLQVNTKYDVFVIFDITIHHFSEGKADRNWVKTAIDISRKWKSQLPVSVYDLSPAEYNYHHWRSLQIFLERLFRLRYSYITILYLYLFYSFNRYFNLRRFLSMGKFVVKSMYRNPGPA